MKNDLKALEELQAMLGVKLTQMYHEEHWQQKLWGQENCFFLSKNQRLIGLYLGRCILPNGIEDLKPFDGLIVLKLYSVKLKNLNGINQHRSLSWLGFSDCGISDIGPVQNLQHLTKIDLISNQISDISPLQHLKQLTDIDLCSNQISDIGPLERKPKIKSLSLLNNLIEKVPSSFSTFESEFRGLDEFETLEFDLFGSTTISSDGFLLGFNPLISPPPEVFERGDKAVRAYLNEAQDQTKALNEVKVIFIGDGASGKTSLIKALIGKETFDEKEDQTHGIQVKPWAYRRKNQPQTKVFFWDFGGQELMHATHQFFLSHRCLYVVVLDNRKDEKPPYWLKHAQNFGGDSPVLVVMNKIDQNKDTSLNQRRLKKDFPAIQDYFPVSCKTGKGIDSLRNAIKIQLDQLPIRATHWPPTWFKVKQKLEKKNSDYLSLAAFEALCEQCGVSEHSREFLVQMLHDLGHSIHFPDLELKDTYVLKPTWVTGAVYRLINSPELSEGQGILNKNQIGTILCRQDRLGPAYAVDKHAYIIYLMEKFELCYRLGKTRILVPDLLPKEEPELKDYDPEKALRLQIHYGFLPHTVMPRLMVRNHERIVDKLRWRTGVVLKSDAFPSDAVIRADYDRNTVFVDLHGKGRREHLAVILAAFRSINSGFKHNKIVEKIACPCKGCAESDDPTYYHLQNVWTFYFMGHDHIQCTNKEGGFVPMNDVLGGVTGTNMCKELEEILDILKAIQAKQAEPDRLSQLGNLASLTGLSLNALLGNPLGYIPLLEKLINR